MSDTAALIEFDWSTGTECYSFMEERTPSVDYEDLLFSLDSITRDVSLYGGGMSIGEISGTLVNRARKFSIMLATVSPRGVVVRVKVLDRSTGYSTAYLIARGRIYDWDLSAGLFSFKARDARFDQLFGAMIAETVPMVTVGNFPDLPVGQAPTLTPLIMGRVGNLNVAAAGWGGSTPSYLVEAAGSPIVYVYVVAARPLGAEPSGGAPATTERWLYRVYEAGGVTTDTFNGVTYAVSTRTPDPRDPTRPDEMELTFYLNGFTEDDNVASTPILDFVRGLEKLLLLYTSLVAGDFDATKQTAAKSTSATYGYADDANPIGYNSPAVLGAVIFDADFAWSDVIELFMESFAAQFYATREGLLATFVDTMGPEPAADFSVDDENDIIGDSLAIAANKEVASVLQYNHGFRWTFGAHGDAMPGSTFERQPDYRIPGEKARIGDYDVRKPINLRYVRSGVRAADIAATYAEYYKSGAHWIEFDLPISFFDQVELNKYVGVTARQGISTGGGFDNVLVRILGITFSFGARDAKIHIKGFQKAAATIVRDNFLTGSTLDATLWTKSGSVAGVFQITGARFQPTVTAGTDRGIALRSETFGANQLSRMRWKDRDGWTGADGMYTAIVVRGSGTYLNFTGYVAAVKHTTNTVVLLKYVAQDLNTGGTQLGSVAAHLSAGSRYDRDDMLELRIDGTSLEVWCYSHRPERNGRIIGPITDSAIAAGAPGVFELAQGAPTAFAQWKEFFARDF